MNSSPDATSCDAFIEHSTNNTSMLLSLNNDLWSECLKFLSPKDMVKASTQICKELSSSPSASSSRSHQATSHAATERAAWLALESAIQQGMELYAGVDNNEPSQKEFKLRRYPGETWMELYSLFWSQISFTLGVDDERTSTVRSVFARQDNGEAGNDGGGGDGVHEVNMAADEGEEEAVVNDFGGVDRQEEDIASEGEANDDVGDNGDEEENATGVDITDAGPSEDKFTIYRSAWIMAVWLLFGYPERVNHTSLTKFEERCSLNAIAFHRIIASHSAEFRLRYRFRILHAALRISDVGLWSGASSILESISVSNDDNSEDYRVALKSYVQGSQDPKCDAEINISICTFLIDRLYSNTYVTANARDSADLSQAVICGRRAMYLCKPLEGTETEKNGSSIEHGTIGNRHDPPPPTLLYPFDTLRYTVASLACGKALSLLAQHIGLSATNIDDIEARPLDIGRSLSPCQGFFQEGVVILRSLIPKLQRAANIDENGSGDVSSCPLMTLEMLVAVYGALGELYYCSSTVVYHANDTDQWEDDLKKSIHFLTLSLRTGQKRFVAEFDAAQRRHLQAQRSTAHHFTIKPLNVETLCSALPRSFMLLQVRTAKDLGKVCSYSGNSSLAERGSSVLDFALAVSARLHFGSHPSVMNIMQLRRRRDIAGAEERANQWLREDPSFERLEEDW